MEPTTTQVKEWYKSKTLWLGVLAIAAGLIEWIQGQLDSGVSLTIMGFVMTLMRLITSTKLK